MPDHHLWNPDHIFLRKLKHANSDMGPNLSYTSEQIILLCKDYAYQLIKIFLKKNYRKKVFKFAIFVISLELICDFNL